MWLPVYFDCKSETTSTPIYLISYDLNTGSIFSQVWDLTQAAHKYIITVNSITDHMNIGHFEQINNPTVSLPADLVFIMEAFKNFPITA